MTEQELAAIREAVAAGRKPRVQFTEAAGQIAGQIGQVVACEDPAVSDEWLVVRFGKDELPFSPADVRPAPKGAAARKPEPVPAVPVRPEPEFVIDKPVESKPVEKPEPEPVAAVPAPRKAPAKAAAKPAKAKPGLTVTLGYADGEWTVAAAQGAKVLAKPYLVKPAEALRMVSLVDVPGVQEAVQQILDGERSQAREQADRLRAELAEVEARLAELDDAS